jgi:hypothetical protein
LAACQVHVLDPQPAAFHEPQARAIQQACHQRVQAVVTIDLVENLPYFGARQHDREAARLARLEGADERQGHFQRLLIKKQQRVKGLILRARGDVSPYHQVGEKGLNMSRPQLQGMALVVKQHIAHDPVDVRLFRPPGIAARS